MIGREKQVRQGLVGLLGVGIIGSTISGCRVCPSGYTEEQENVCVKEEKQEEVLGNYTFDEVYSLTTSLVTTLDPAEACAGFSHVSVNGGLSAYEECTTTYAQLQDNLPVFSSEDTVVNSGITPLLVYQMGAYNYFYFTGSGLSVEFKDLEHGVFLSGTIYIVEEGCKYNMDHYYKGFVCYSSAYEEPEESDEAQQGCTMTMDHLQLRPAFSYCGITDLIEIQSDANYFKEEALNENLLLLHYDYARALEELVLDVEEE